MSLKVLAGAISAALLIGFLGGSLFTLWLKGGDKSAAQGKDALDTPDTPDKTSVAKRADTDKPKGGQAGEPKPGPTHEAPPTQDKKPENKKEPGQPPASEKKEPDQPKQGRTPEGPGTEDKKPENKKEGDALTTMRREREAEKAARRGAGAYKDFPEPWRSRFVKDWENEVQAVKERLQLATMPREKQRLTARLKALKNNVVPTTYFHNHNFAYKRLPQWRVGDYGACWLKNVRVFHATDQEHVVIGTPDDGPLVMLKCIKYPTPLTENAVFSEIPGFVHVTGTTTYQSAPGKTKTVLAAELWPNRNALKNRFVGRWRIETFTGKVGCYFTLTDSFEAKKSNAPEATGKWEVVGDEARITWSDGWREILRPERGKVVKIAFPPEAKGWDGKPASIDRAIKER